MQFKFKDKKHIHFIGIGGISMSGIAELLLLKGFPVSGSDMHKSELTDALEEKGARIFIPQSADNLDTDVSLVVYTAAIRDDNPELSAARKRGIETVSRAELLGAVMKEYPLSLAVAGTHGKTTTTGMLSQIMLGAGTDPTLSIGGIFPFIGGNFRSGNGRVFVTEACEYTDSFLSLPGKIEVILNIDLDHTDYFRDIEDLRSSFRQFASLVPEDGTLVISDDVERLSEITSSCRGRVVTFGLSEEADIFPEDIHRDDFSRSAFIIRKKDGSSLGRVSLRVPGEHNIRNALAAAAAADSAGISGDNIVSALSSFTGTARRFEEKGTFRGIRIIDDYAHHPTEIRATLKAALECPRENLWCVFQPHTYSRTKAFLKEFAQALSLADKVVLAEIYPARETDTLGISSENLAEELRSLGTECYCFSDFSAIENFLSDNCVRGDLLITMGAGNVNIVGEDLLQKQIST